MNLEQAKKELDAAKDFYNLLLRQKISNPVDMLINYMITPYNQIMSDERLRDWILENEELATEAYESLIKAQDYLIIQGLMREKEGILPIPELKPEELRQAMDTFNHLIGLSIYAEKARNLFEELREFKKAGTLQTYLKYETNRNTLSSFIDLFNKNAIELIQIKPVLIKNLKKQNLKLYSAGIQVMKTLAFWIDQLLQIGLKPAAEQQQTDFRKLEPRALAA